MEKDYYLPPDRDKANYAEQFNPNRVSPDHPEHDRLKKLYERYQREAIEGTAFDRGFELTVGPHEFIRYEYHYGKAEGVPSVSVARTDEGCWLVNDGDPVRYIWSCIPNVETPGPAHQRIEQLMYEAASESEELVRFGIADWKRHMITSVAEADGGFDLVVAAADGTWHVRSEDAPGRLVMSKRIRTTDIAVTVYTYDQFANVNGAMIARRIIRTHGPREKSASANEHSRFQYRIKDIAPGLVANWRGDFSLPDRWVDPDGNERPIEFEFNLDQPASEPIRLTGPAHASPTARASRTQSRED